MNHFNFKLPLYFKTRLTNWWLPWKTKLFPNRMAIFVVCFTLLLGQVVEIYVPFCLGSLLAQSWAEQVTVSEVVGSSGSGFKQCVVWWFGAVKQCAGQQAIIIGAIISWPPQGHQPSHSHPIIPINLATAVDWRFMLPVVDIGLKAHGFCTLSVTWTMLSRTDSTTKSWHCFTATVMSDKNRIWWIGAELSGGNTSGFRIQWFSTVSTVLELYRAKNLMKW